MDFAVWHEGIEEGQARWVLAVDGSGDRVLLADLNQLLYWMPLADCRFARAAGPDQPRPVLVLSPQQGPAIAVPNRSMRRGLERNGGF